MQLQKLTNVAIIVTCVILSTYVIMGFVQTRSTPRSEPSYHPGDLIKDTPDLAFNQARKTLILTTTSHCQFCSNSMPFYKRLVAIAQQAGVRVVGVTSEDVNVNKHFLMSNGVQVDTILPYEKSNVQVNATPTLILVKSDGKVINAWRGMLSKQSEDEVVSQIVAR